MSSKKELQKLTSKLAEIIRDQTVIEVQEILEGGDKYKNKKKKLRQTYEQTLQKLDKLMK